MKPENLSQREQVEDINILKLPEDSEMIKMLEDKLTQYYGRMKKIKGKIETTNEYGIRYRDTEYKIFILKTLLHDGQVDVREVIERFEGTLGSDFKINDLYSSWAVILDYLKTGGKNIKNGGGFGHDNKVK